MALAMGLGRWDRSVAAQATPVLRMLDLSAIDVGDDPHLIPADTANITIADVGLRAPLPFLAARTGESIMWPIGARGTIGCEGGEFSARLAGPSSSRGRLAAVAGSHGL